MMNEKKISHQTKTIVLLATYNGELYIKEQLTSIINQSTKPHRIIINDDFSNDNTIKILHDLKKTIFNFDFLLSHKNIGHVKSFEKLLHYSKDSDIIFFCDQDDFWNSQKIENVMQIFNENKSVNLIHHELLYVDENLNDLTKINRKIKFGLQNKIFFLIRQFYKPELFGCAIAVRSNLIEKLLPFPSCVYAHDHWLSIIAPFHGDVYMSPLQLVKYRQHSNNLTPKKKNSFSKIFKFRFLFLNMIIIALYRKLFVHAK